ncbi:unnamed protein product, partial [Brugia pahangi]|uniref:Cytochrome b n=1 Tax=Brugia pahangi TaxID=6280 RepID=A0A0N4T9B8_BRUPA
MFGNFIYKFGIFSLLTYFCSISSCSYYYNYGCDRFIRGFILGIMLISQIITGFFLTFYYTAGDTFSSVQHVIFEVNLGWLIRIIHSNGASIIFLFVYLHIFKGLIYGSYRLSGQIRYWAAVVITSLITSVPYLGNLYFSFNLSDPIIFVESDSIASPAHTMLDNILYFLSICFVENIIFLKFRKYHKMEFSYYPIIFGVGVLGIDFGLDVFLEDVSGQYSLYDYRMFSQGFRLFLFNSSLCPLTWLGGIWSPIGILSPDYLGINGMASLFLIINRQVLKYSRRYLCLNINKCENLLLLCIFIGAFFLCFQFFEYTHNCFVINDRIYGRVFYIGTGLHGSHVLIGVFFLVINFFRVKFHNFNWYHTQ